MMRVISLLLLLMPRLLRRRTGLLRQLSMSGRSPTVKYQLFGKPPPSDVQRTHAPGQAG